MYECFNDAPIEEAISYPFKTFIHRCEQWTFNLFSRRFVGFRIYRSMFFLSTEYTIRSCISATPCLKLPRVDLTLFMSFGNSRFRWFDCSRIWVSQMKSSRFRLRLNAFYVITVFKQLEIYDKKKNRSIILEFSAISCWMRGAADPGATERNETEDWRSILRWHNFLFFRQ